MSKLNRELEELNMEIEEREVSEMGKEELVDAVHSLRTRLDAQLRLRKLDQAMIQALRRKLEVSNNQQPTVGCEGRGMDHEFQPKTKRKAEKCEERSGKESRQEEVICFKCSGRGHRAEACTSRGRLDRTAYRAKRRQIRMAEMERRTGHRTRTEQNKVRVTSNVRRFDAGYMEEEHASREEPNSPNRGRTNTTPKEGVRRQEHGVQQRIQPEESAGRVMIIDKNGSQKANEEELANFEQVAKRCGLVALD